MEDKKAVMLVLGRKVIADLLIKSIGKRVKMEAFGIYDYKNAGTATLSRKPYLALVEIPEKHGFPALDTLNICGEIKEANPECKIVLLCPEQDKESVDICINAKKRGEIEDFLFYDSSVDYLASKLESLCPI
jgi:DNA-binding NarL/FixJ family response regulator